MARPLEEARELQPKPRRSRQGLGIDQAEHALAGEDEARAREPEQMADCSDHKRQPECSATMPPLMRSVRHARKARGAHHLGKRVRAREAADQFDQIAVGLGIAHDGAAERRHDVEGIELVERIEPGHIHIGELEAEESPAEPEHAVHLGQRHVDARHIADAECDRDRIEAVVREWQRLGVGIDERHHVVEPAFHCALAPDASISALMSATVARVPAPPASIVRNDTSPVPPATSSSANSRPAFHQDGRRPFGGLIAVTSASFQARCSPPDIRSFIRS